MRHGSNSGNHKCKKTHCTKRKQQLNHLHRSKKRASRASFVAPSHYGLPPFTHFYPSDTTSHPVLAGINSAREAETILQDERQGSNEQNNVREEDDRVFTLAIVE